MSDINPRFMCIRCGGVNEDNGVAVRYPAKQILQHGTCSVCGKQDLGLEYIKKSEAKRLKGGRK